MKFDLDALIEMGAKVRLESSSFTEAVNRKNRTNFAISGVRGKRAYDFIEACAKTTSHQCDPEIMINKAISLDMMVEAIAVDK